MKEFASVPLGKYSKGMLQRIGLCQALLNEPKLLLFDEPMSGLDPIGRALVREIILEERDRGCTVFFSSHILSDVETVCDRIAILHKGVLRGVGTLSELTGQQEKYFECICISSVNIPFEGRVSSHDSRHVFHVQEAELYDFIECAKSQGAQIQSITEHRRSLEEVFVDQVNSSQPLDPKNLGVLV